jgi:hypothetical protein
LQGRQAVLSLLGALPTTALLVVSVTPEAVSTQHQRLLKLADLSN